MKFSYKKCILLTFVFISYSFVTCSGQDSLDSLIKQIKVERDKINSGLKTYNVIEKDVNDLSSEGGTLKKFKDGNAIRKAELILYGETGQSLTEYYFLNGGLIFVSKETEMYKMPIDMGKVETASLVKNGFYFKDQKLIRWIGSNGKIVDSALYTDKEKEILDEFKSIY